MDAKARIELVSSTLEYLQNVIGASGKADELVKLTTDIVQNAKRLVENAPEHMRTKSTAVLAEFVKAARTIAKDARAVDSQSLQQLSSTKRAVEAVVKELDQWHASRSPNDEIEVALNELCVPRQDSSPPGTPATEREKKLQEELKRQKALISKKKEPQRAPEQHGYPEDVLHMAASGLIRSANELVEAASQKSPSKEALLEPMILMSRMVSILMDLVDSLFVSKYPMRTQVHSFCCTLTENVLAYHAQSKTDDLSSLRTISTQAPAMLSAVEVMAERCKERAQDVEINKKFSIQRNVGLLELDTFGPGRSPGSSPAMGRKRQPPPQAPEKKQEKVEFEICCMICTSVAVDQKTQQPMAKGSELTLMATPTTTIRDVRRVLSERTGLSLDHIQLRFQGDDVLPDDKKVTPNNPVPYFVFNLYEPSEEELREIKRDLRRKNRLKIEDVQWDKLSNPMAVALFDYEALGDTGEDSNLEFEEGDIIEITEKSADGWWTGLLDGKMGIFPASFVEEIPEPRTKEERKRLIKRFRNRQFSDPLGYAQTQTQSQTQSITFNDSEEPQKKPAQLQIISSESKRSSSPKLGKMLKKITAEVPRVLSPSSIKPPSPTKPPSSTKPSKYQRRVSEPVFSQFEQPRQASKKKSLFKKRSPPYSVISEEGPSYGDYPKPRSPILSSPTRRKKPTIAESLQEEEKPVTEWHYSQQPPRRPLVRPASSPKLPRVPPPTAGSSSPGTKVKRRPPPPVPPPYAATHGRKGLNELLHRQKSDEAEETHEESTVPPEIPPSPPPPAAESPPLAFTATDLTEEEEEDTEEDISPSRVLPSKSMEDLFNDLAEFDATQELLDKHNGVKERGTERDYATIPRSELPVTEGKKKVPEVEPPAKEDSPQPPLPPRIDVTDSPSSSPKIHSKSERPTKPLIPSKPVALRKPQPPPKPAVPSKPNIPPARPVENGLDRERKSESPQPPPPVPPPRTKKTRSLKKSKGGESERQDGRSSPKPARHAPPPPPKPKEQKLRQWALLEAAEKPACSSAPVSRTASPEEINSSAALGVGRLSREGSASTNALSRSPVVMRRTHTVVSSDTPEPFFADDDLEECTGIGKEGILYKEGTSSRDWKARFFQLLHNKIIYFETTSYTGLEDAKPLGQVLVNRMQGAVPLGEKNNFHCFAIKMRYDTSVVLGSHTQIEMDDWVKSINKMIKIAKPGGAGRAKAYNSSYRTAMKCITYLSEGNRPALDRVFTAVGGNMGRVNRWLDSIDKGEDPELSDMPDAITAVALLKVLFKQGRLGCLVSSPLAKDLCELVKSTSPVSVLGTKLEQLPNDSRGLLKQLLRLFSQVLDYSDKNHTDVGDLNRVFGPLVFESVTAMHSEPLLAYLISTCELVIS